MIEIKDWNRQPGSVFALAEDEGSSDNENLECHDLSSSLSKKDIERLLESRPTHGPLSATIPEKDTARPKSSPSRPELASLLDAEHDAGYGIPDWAGFFELPG